MKVSKERKEAILKKMLPPYSISVPVLARQEDIPKNTLYAWRSELKRAGELVSDNRSSKSRSKEEKFMMVVETAILSESELSEYCRKKGLYPSELKTWRQACIDGNSVKSAQRVQNNSAELKSSQQQIKQLEKALHRKEKALAETAALLVLRKKLNALWEDDDEAV